MKQYILKTAHGYVKENGSGITSQEKSDAHRYPTKFDAEIVRWRLCYPTATIEPVPAY